jgi:hypothetical protein
MNPLHHLVEAILNDDLPRETPRGAVLARVAAANARANGDAFTMAKSYELARDFVESTRPVNWRDALRANVDCAEAHQAAGDLTAALDDWKRAQAILRSTMAVEGHVGFIALTGMIAVLERISTGCCGCGGCGREVVDAARK